MKNEFRSAVAKERQVETRKKCPSIRCVCDDHSGSMLKEQI